MSRHAFLLASLVLCLLSAGVSCGSKSASTVDNSEVLVSVGDSTLTVNYVLQRMPSGLEPEDSIALFNKIVDEWVRDMVLSDYAESNIFDLDRIDRMVTDYRNNLIINEYLSSMTESEKKEVSEDRLRRFYDENIGSLVLEQPVIKGVFLKVAESDETLPDLRKWMSQFGEADIDNIEKSGLRQALKYKYFKDEWVEWNVIAEQIPYRFYDADAFIRSTRLFETADGGNVYLLRISDYIPSGETMPYAFAKNRIADILQSADMASYRRRLVGDIYKRQIKEGILKPGAYDPLQNLK